MEMKGYHILKTRSTALDVSFSLRASASVSRPVCTIIFSLSAPAH